jgi:hypothetical protein
MSRYSFVKVFCQAIKKLVIVSKNVSEVYEEEVWYFQNIRRGILAKKIDFFSLISDSISAKNISL